MKRKVLVSAAFLFLGCMTYAGNPFRSGSPVRPLPAGPGGSSTYNTGIGLRGGLASGLTVKHFIREGAALEGIISPAYKGSFIITGLYEIHAPAFSVSGLQWYYGAGAHIGFYPGGVPIGIDGILGIEYKIFEIPFVVGLDIKPAIHLNYFSASYFDGALSLRYAF
jgi:hypothetical protein